ncbi:WD40 repeat domain-containing protein [Rhizobium alvei]|uniref:Strictosidine synthase conserved region domain-containing protein n=1 Tax=Rhizobium alvei TaxID=1132659 RepID=A0ABT8YID2_9HYPH|nr:hypothetical protein [Rhizobium alvei]MDO6963386.1 hypothetical protein [Rhizobium alvei]
MIGAIRRYADHVFGRGDASIFVPVMDGPLKANERLDGCEALHRIDAVDNLTATADGLLASSGAKLLRLTGTISETVTKFDNAISALAVAPDGRLAVGLDDGRVLVFSSPGGEQLARIDVSCPTALLFLQDGRLAIASGSPKNTPAHWSRDLMSHGTTGRVLIWTAGAATPVELARDLAWPYGLAVGPDGKLIVSESWLHRLVLVDPQQPGAAPKPTPLRRLPGYPSRIVPAKGGGYWLSIFAPRNQLVEFTLAEKEYLQRMLATVPEEFWVAPKLRSGGDFREVLQGGGVKQMGVLKPWAPSLSYGLVVRLDQDLRPRSSLHSRANGRVHGITSVATADLGGEPHLWIGAKGDGVVLALPEAEI